mmetsp:Transcript_153568/g.492188  ORF Transcript_153568/g.492188 Transcript_153568/m.492188 type:complete len:217 (+) Transcript_153568:151-801(+)
MPHTCCTQGVCIHDDGHGIRASERGQLLPQQMPAKHANSGLDFCTSPGAAEASSGVGDAARTSAFCTSGSGAGAGNILLVTKRFCNSKATSASSALSALLGLLANSRARMCTFVPYFRLNCDIFSITNTSLLISCSDGDSGNCGGKSGMALFIALMYLAHRTSKGSASEASSTSGASGATLRKRSNPWPSNFVGNSSELTGVHNHNSWSLSWNSKI